MKSISRRSITLLATLAVAIGSFVVTTTSTAAASKYFTVSGQVLKIDQKARTLLVSDRSSKKLYLINIPEGVTFKITFGKYMQMSEPGFSDVSKNERVAIRCEWPAAEHLTRLGDGTQVVPLTASR